MKIKVLKKNTRQGLIAILLFFLVLSLAGLYWSLTRPAETEEEYTAFSYSQEADIGYRVYLHPNELFAEPALDAGRAYISALTDTVNTQFAYRFSAEEEAEIKGEYSVVASIEAVTGQDNHPVWEKSYILHPPQSFYVNGEEVTLFKNIKLPFSEYAAYTREITEQTSFVPDKVNLIVSYDVSLTANTPDGSIEESSTPKVIIPLRGNVFTVGGTLEMENSGEITAVRQLAVPYYEEAKIGFSLVSSLMFLVLLNVIQMTVVKEEKNNFLKQKLARILKKYEDRVVKCTEEIPILNPNHMLTVSTFEDMVKAADELEKPILYHQTGSEGEHSFYVISEQYVYRYNLGALASSSVNTLSQNYLVKHLR